MHRLAHIDAFRRIGIAADVGRDLQHRAGVGQARLGGEGQAAGAETECDVGAFLLERDRAVVEDIQLVQFGRSGWAVENRRHVHGISANCNGLGRTVGC